MKRTLGKTFTFLAWLLAALMLLFFAMLVFKSVAALVFGIIEGNVYRKVGETVMTTDARRTETLAIYKAKGKPFLIVGPCVFHNRDEKSRDEWKDFFFVRRDQVIRTATDKGGDAWFRLAGLLFILDDMTNRDRVRMPFWDDLEREGASVRYDEKTASYVYSLLINYPRQRVSFAIPARFFTPDMPMPPNI